MFNNENPFRWSDEWKTYACNDPMTKEVAWNFIKLFMRKDNENVSVHYEMYSIIICIYGKIFKIFSETELSKSKIYSVIEDAYRAEKICSDMIKETEARYNG